MKIIKESEIIETVTYSLEFDYVGQPGCGFAFPCDENGVVGELAPAGADSYRQCLKGSVDGKEVVRVGVNKFENRYRDPAIGQCSCGGEVVLEGFTCCCDSCDALYNSAGQALAPREQWGEETGEHWSEIE